MLEKMIIRFLDDYLGNEVYVSRRKYTWSDRVEYSVISSKSNTKIVSFVVSSINGGYNIFRSAELVQTVSTLFSIGEDVASRYIQNWFGDVHGLNKVGDLEKFLLMVYQNDI